MWKSSKGQIYLQPINSPKNHLNLSEKKSMEYFNNSQISLGQWKVKQKESRKNPPFDQINT